MSKPFECSQCGLCCLGIGEIVRMDRKISEYRYTVINEVVREEREAEITPEYREIFDNDKSIQKEHPAACFFVRKRADGKYVCTIHPYRLFICKDYCCCRARIYKSGAEAGKVKGLYTIITKDENLKKLWYENVQMNKNADDKFTESILKKFGYTIQFYDNE